MTCLGSGARESRLYHYAKLFIYLSDDLAGIAGREDFLGDVPRDHTPGTDDRLRADANAGAEDGSPADPHVRANLNRLGELLLPPQLRAHRMCGRVDLDRRTEEGEVADPHLTHIEHDAVEVEE